MTNNVKVKPPAWFWIVSIAGLIWNIMGVINYLGQAYTSVQDLEKMSQAERLLFESQPAWVTGAFAIAVWGGVLGCIALLLRKKWARPVLLISLIGILLQMAHSFFMTNATEVYGATQGIMIPLLVIVIGIVLVLFARKSQNVGWIS